MLGELGFIFHLPLPLPLPFYLHPISTNEPLLLSNEPLLLSPYHSLLFLLLLSSCLLKSHSYPTNLELRATSLIPQKRWNEPVITPLVQGAVETLLKAGVKKENIVIQTVPGSYELPTAVARLVDSLLC